MKKDMMKIALILLTLAIAGVQGADAQKTITRRQNLPSQTTPASTSGGKKPVKKPTKPTTTPVKTNAMDYVTITRLQVGNTNYDGDVLTSYGGTLYADELKYATPKLTYTCSRSVSNVTLYTKIYRPDGTMMTGSSSPSGYTTSDEADFEKGNSQTLVLPGWGNNDGGSYQKGLYRWELWYKSKRLISSTFQVYERAVSSTGSGSGSFEFYGTTRSYTDNAKALSYITKTIKEWGDDGCRTGAITEDERGVAVYGDNGYCFTSAVPEGLKTKIRECNNDKKRIADITMTDSGYWCIVWDKNGYWGVMPDKMKELMSKYNGDGEEILSVSICENGNFAIITNKHYYASHETDHANLKRALEKFGAIKSCSVTNKGIVVCCSRGVYYKDIPTNVEEALKDQDFHPAVVKFTDSGTYLITDGVKQRSWYM